MTETITIPTTSIPKPPLFLRLRCSTNFIAFTVALGVLVDLAGYGIIVPVLPFKLAELGYDNIGSRVGWLVSSYALGLILSTPFIAYAGEKYKGRRIPLIIALLFMAGALVLFMETTSYALMIVSRFLQGVSGTGIWTIGLAMITDSVPSVKIGIVMGYVMVGFSVGSLIGPPVGGVLYHSLGYRAVFIFALILVFFDLALRLLVIEKHTAIKYIEAGIEVPGFEAPNFIPKTNSSEQVSSSKSDLSVTPTPSLSSSELLEKERVEQEATIWSGLKSMMTSARPLSLFALTLLNGFVLGGMLDTGMTLWLEENWQLDAQGAGLVFIGAVAPSFIASPVAGWACDKYGTKGVAALGLILSIPAYALLIIRGPLALFVFFLVMMGSSLSFFLTPTLADLSVVVELTPGLGAAVVYAIFNAAYSFGAFLGPIVAGNAISAIGIEKGWILLCALSAGLSLILAPFVVFYVGGPIKWKKGEKEVEMETVLKEEKVIE